MLDSNKKRKNEALGIEIPSMSEYEVEIKENDTP
jgi:hypothetical protein